jgi:hypothetical protein
MKDAHYASAMERETAAARGVGLAGGRGSIRPQGHNRLDAGSSRTESNENLRFGSPDSVVRTEPFSGLRLTSPSSKSQPYGNTRNKPIDAIMPRVPFTLKSRFIWMLFEIRQQA